jgi:hypothetical protein
MKCDWKCVVMDSDHVVQVALIAPSNYHMVLQRNGAKYIVKIKMAPKYIIKARC